MDDVVGKGIAAAACAGLEEEGGSDDSMSDDLSSGDEDEEDRREQPRSRGGLASQPRAGRAGPRVSRPFTSSHIITHLGVTLRLSHARAAMTRWTSLSGSAGAQQSPGQALLSPDRMMHRWAAARPRCGGGSSWMRRTNRTATTRMATRERTGRTRGAWCGGKPLRAARAVALESVTLCSGALLTYHRNTTRAAMPRSATTWPRWTPSFAARRWKRASSAEAATAVAAREVRDSQGRRRRRRRPLPGRASGPRRRRRRGARGLRRRRATRRVASGRIWIWTTISSRRVLTFPGTVISSDPACSAQPVQQSQAGSHERWCLPWVLAEPAGELLVAGGSGWACVKHAGDAGARPAGRRRQGEGKEAAAARQGGQRGRRRDVRRTTTDCWGGQKNTPPSNFHGNRFPFQGGA